MTLNVDLVRARCVEIEECLARLEQIRALSKENFLAQQDTLDIACYRLLVAIEAAIALCSHVSARRLQKVPDDYADCFRKLEGAQILEPELAGRLQRMARFRNLLAHMYWKLDYERVYGTIQRDLDDLRQFCSSIASLI